MLILDKNNKRPKKFFKKILTLAHRYIIIIYRGDFMKLIPKKNGKGYITSYTLSVGSKEAKDLNFVDKNGNSKELEKCLNAENSELIIKIKNL